MTSWRVAALAAGLAIAAAVLWISRVDTSLATLQKVDPVLLVCALLLNVPVLGLRAYRAGLLLNFLGHDVRFRAMLPVQLIGQTSSTLTPAAAGDYVRAYMWRREQQVPFGDGASVVTFERLYSLFLLAVVAVALISLPQLGSFGWLWVGLGLAAATLAPLLLVLTPTSAVRWGLKRPTGPGLLQRAGALRELTVNLRRLVRSPKVLWQTSGITLVLFLVSGFQVLFLVLGLGHTIQVHEAVAVYATSQVAGIVSALPFGLGPADAILVALLGGYGVGVGDSAIVALLFRAVSTVPVAVAALVAYLWVAHPKRANPDVAPSWPRGWIG